MLSKEYISNNDITQDNVNNYIDDVSDTAYFIPLIAKSIQNNDSTTTRYIVYGIEEDINYNFLRDLYIIIILIILKKTKVNLDMIYIKIYLN